MKKYLLTSGLIILAFYLGLSVKHVPFFSLDRKIGFIETLTFIVVVFFGMYLQQKISKDSTKSGQNNDILKQIDVDINCAINKVITIVEDCSWKSHKKMTDTAKRRVQIEFKNISFLISLFTDVLSLDDENYGELKGKYRIFKDSVINEDFMLSTFKISDSYTKSVMSDSNTLKGCLKIIIIKSS